MSRHLTIGLLLAGTLGLLCGGCTKDDPRSHAMQITSDAQLIGGPAALGKVGDYLMYNDQIRLIVRNEGTSPGFGIYGGALLDVDLIRGPDERPGGEGADQFGEMFTLANFVAPQPIPDMDPAHITVVADGSDGGPAIVRVEGQRALYLYLLRLLADMLNADEEYFQLRTDYILHPGASYLEITTEVYIPEEVAAANGLTTDVEWHDLGDKTDAVNPFAQLVNGILPPVVAEAEDLAPVDGFDDRVRSESVDFAAAGVVAGHTIKIEVDGALEHVAIAAVDPDGDDPHVLELEDDVDVVAGAYFRVLGETGDAGEVFGDFLFMGAKVHFFMPDDENALRADWNGGMGVGIGFDYTGAMLDVSHAGGSTFSDPFVVDYFAGTGRHGGVSYAYGTREGKVSIPLLASSFSVTFTHDSDYTTLMLPGHAIRFTRYLAVGEGDVASAAGVLMEQVRGEPVGRVEGHVIDGRHGEGVSGAWVLALRDPDPDADELPGEDALAGPVSQFETDMARDSSFDGSFGGLLRPGDYLLQAIGPGNARSEMVRVTVTDGDTVEALLVLPETGRVQYDVVDLRGEHIPCKLTLYGRDGAGRPDSVLGQGYLPGDISYVEFTADGSGEIEVMPGTYDVVVSRGPEYDLDRLVVMVSAGATSALTAEIARVVDTTGWVSGDFHLHMANSPDAGLSHEERITTCMAEGLEYAVASDHDYNTDLRPTIEAMGATEYIKSSVGNELTTIEMGHFNGWPMAFDPSAPEDGVVDWQVPSDRGEPVPEERPDLDVMIPQDIYDALRAGGRYGEDLTVVQNNHPRDGLLGNFYQYGIDITTGEPSGELNFLELFHPRINADHFSYDFDAIEATNGKRQDLVKTPTHADLEEFEAGGSLYDFMARTEDEQEALRTGQTTLASSYSGAVDDWFNWLNQGYRYTITGNSDSHTKTKVECADVRNYVASSSDLPDFIDEQEITANILQGRAFHTYGPFIEFEIEGDGSTGGLGDTVIDDDGIVDLHIRVQSATWFDVDRIEVFQNGVMVCAIESDHTCGDPADNYGLFHPNEHVVNFDGSVEIDLTDWWFKAMPDDDIPADPVPLDSWFAVVAMGDSSVEPVVTPVTREPIRVSDVLSGAMGELRFEDMSGILGSIDIGLGASFHVVFDIMPWAITNAIWVDTWVDVDDDGEWDEPGLPGYLGTYAEPE